MKCLFIGTLHQHAAIGRVAALHAAGFNVSLLNVGSIMKWPDQYQVEGAIVAGDLNDTYYRGGGGGYGKEYLREYFRVRGLLREEKSIIHQIQTAINAIKPDVVVVHYGTIAIHYARILKKLFPSLPVVDILNVIPIHCKGLDTYPVFKGKALELRSYRSWLKHIDGVICASMEMADYVKKEFHVHDDRILIAPDFLPGSFRARGKKDASELSPSVIFLGAPERWGHSIDAIDAEFLNMAHAGIHVVSASISDEVIATGYGHKYPIFSEEEVFNGTMASYAAQFDAALITYNVSEREERFRSTLPTRFVTALTTGLPLAVHGGVFDACENFVLREEIGFAYSSAVELKEILMDKARLDLYGSNARKKQRFFTAESQGDDIKSFIMKIINCNNSAT